MVNIFHHDMTAKAIKEKIGQCIKNIGHDIAVLGRIIKTLGTNSNAVNNAVTSLKTDIAQT